MLLLNAKHAYIPDEKLYDYALSETHPVGKHKAIVFRKVLGLTIEDAEFLRQVILEKVLVQEAVYEKTTHFGELYTVDFLLEMKERSAIIRTAWIILKEENIPRLTSCYIL